LSKVPGTPKQRSFQLLILHVEYAERGKEYSILFTFSLFCEYSHLEYVHIHVVYKVNQAKYVMHTLLFAPQEYVNIYATSRFLILRSTKRIVKTRSGT